MTEEDIFKLLKDAIVRFNAEGNSPETRELIQKAFQTGLDAGFSGEEIEAIAAQIQLKSQDVENGLSGMALKLTEYQLRRTARNFIQIGGSIEDFLAGAKSSYDRFLEEEQRRNPSFGDDEAHVQSIMLQQMVKNIWFEEQLKE
jgi:hypothetical protein